MIFSISHHMAVATTLAKPSIMDVQNKAAISDANTEMNFKTEANSKLLLKQQKASPLARVIAQAEKYGSADSSQDDKNLTLTVSEFQDNSGLVYLGGEVSVTELSRYLDQLKSELGEEQYALYRQYQSARDQQTFHVTLVNPYEYQTINKKTFKSPLQFRVTLHGLGRVNIAEKESYFVVASSPDGQFIRQNLLLNNKDFHVTLGFFPDDVYGVSKGRDTLIYK